MDFYLFQFRQSQRVVIFDSELHKTHVGRMCELCDDTKPWKQSAEQEYEINDKIKEKKKAQSRLHYSHKYDLKSV